MRMKSLWIALAAVAMLAAGEARAAESKDEMAIRARSDEFVAAWNKHDAKAMPRWRSCSATSTAER
jgi:hypothetical protein